MLAHVVGHGGLNEVDLLPVGRSARPRETQVWTGVVLHQPQRLGIEDDAAGHVADVDGDVIDTGRRYRVAHVSEPTTWRTMAATAGTAAAPVLGDVGKVDT